MQKLKKPCELTQSLCARFVQNVDLWQKNHGKIDGKNSFVEGEPVAVISENADGLIVRIKDARVAISKEMAGRILVA